MATGITISDTPPSFPAVGDAWWDSVSGQLFIWVVDGTSNQWVIAVNQPGGIGPAGAAGPPGPPGPVGPRGPRGPIGPGTASTAAWTIGGLINEARQLLNDEIPISGAPRYADSELMNALNEGMLQIRSKRPDAFLRLGLRGALPVYHLPADLNTPFPIEAQFYSPLLFYVVGRSELTEDTFADDGRAVTLMSKFVAMLLKHTG
jgi:hypothetical protein